MHLTLTYCPVACSLVPYVLLSEAQASFDVMPVNLGKGENNSAEYLRINPNGKVPALIIDGVPLTENVAIQIWIARQFPQAQLLPEDPMDNVRAISLMAWCASGLHPKITQQQRPQRYCSLPGSEDSVRALGSQALLAMYAIADAKLAGREWFFDHFTCADAYFYWCFRRGTMFKPDVSGFRNCTAHLARMEQRASVRKLLAYGKQVKEAFAKAG